MGEPSSDHIRLLCPSIIAVESSLRHAVRPPVHHFGDHHRSPDGRLFELRWNQVDFKHRTINFNQVGQKQTNKRRAVLRVNYRAYAALEEAARGALTDWIIEWDGKQVKSIKKAIRMAAKRSGVSCSPHVFRHTAAVWSAQADVPMQKIAQFMDHTSTRVTERTYARYSPSFMKDVAAALEF